LEGGVINSTHVTRTAGLVVLGLKGKRINIDTGGGNVGVVLVRLDQIEIRSESFLESIVSVQLEFSSNNGISTSVDGTKSSVIGEITSSGNSTEISRSQIVGVRTRTSREVNSSNLGIGSSIRNTTSTNG